MKALKTVISTVGISLLLLCNSAIAQISKGGTPPSFSQFSLLNSVTIIELPPMVLDSAK